MGGPGEFERREASLMKYVSTRSQALPLTFSQAVSKGLASDGGLFVPEKFPTLDISSFTPKMELADFAAQLLSPFLEGDDLQSRLPPICKAAFNFPIPLRMLKDGAVLELIHGPTAAFKDVGARFLAECIARIPSDTIRTVIVATSGDTGGAVGGAFVGQRGIEVIILFPKGKISARQEKQIACWGQNVKAFAVQGSFDDCQKIVKEALADSQLSRTKNFISANSISIGRLLPQMIYYAKSSLEYVAARAATPNYVIPTGNLGNAVAALWAKKIGFPIGQVAFATNANRSISDFFETGVWKPNKTIATLANAMDVGNPSNMERLRMLYSTPELLKRDLRVESVTDDEIKTEITSVFKSSGDILCPHTATAFVAKRKLAVPDAIIVATAHAAKFETIVEPLIGKTISVPPALERLLSRNSVFTEIAPTFSALKNSLR